MASITIPQGVELIDRQAFGDCTRLKTVNLPDTLTEIGGYAFYNCTALETFLMPNSVTTLHDGIFKNCTNLKSLTLSENLTGLAYGMFENCAITELVIPAKVEFLGNAFWGNGTLQKITIQKAQIDFGALALEAIPESITGIYVQADQVGAFKTNFPSLAEKIFAIGQQ